jgi:hypothetical protein
MRVCFDEGVLQSYCDGELRSEQKESVALHAASCVTCAAQIRVIESENASMFAALQPEFEAAVPSERLRNRIDAAVAGIHSAATRNEPHPFFGFLSELFANQKPLAYASLILVFGLVLGLALIKFRSQERSNPMLVARTSEAPKNAAEQSGQAPGQTIASMTLVPTAVDKTSETSRAPQFVAAKYRLPRPTEPEPDAAHVRFLPGERTYLREIAALDSTIKSGNKTMKPALQAEYERNLAFVDHALAAARAAAKNNPNDPDAAEFMFSAYQNKVDLLNTVADARLYNRQP